MMPVVTENTIHRDYRPKCKKHIEPVVPDAIPNATHGYHVMALTNGPIGPAFSRPITLSR